MNFLSSNGKVNSITIGKLTLPKETSSIRDENWCCTSWTNVIWFYCTRRATSHASNFIVKWVIFNNIDLIVIYEISCHLVS